MDLGLFPPAQSQGQGTPPPVPPPWRGSATYPLSDPWRQSEFFLIVVDEDRKQFAVEGPLGVTRPETARLQWFKRGERARSFEFGAVSRMTECVVTIYTVWIIVYPSG